MNTMIMSIQWLNEQQYHFITSKNITLLKMTLYTTISHAACNTHTKSIRKLISTECNGDLHTWNKRHFFGMVIQNTANTVHNSLYQQCDISPLTWFQLIHIIVKKNHQLLNTHNFGKQSVYKCTKHKTAEMFKTTHLSIFWEALEC